MFEVSQTSNLKESEMGTLGDVVTKSPNTPIITIKFDGTNYLTWSKSFLIHMQDKDKEEYLTREVKKSFKDNPKFRKWKTENAMVIEWLVGSMKPEISNHYLFLEIAH